MLKTFRNKNVAKMVLWAILILILPAFVLWGTGSLGGNKNKGPSYAGTIGGRKVSFEQFARALTGVRCQVILNYYSRPDMLDNILSNKGLLGKMAWDRLLMEREARAAGYSTSNAEVVSFIKSHPIFIRNDRFDDRVYSYVLQRVPIDPRSFEETVRGSLAIQKLNDAVAKEVVVTDAEVLESYKKESDRIKLSYVIFPADSYVQKVTIDDAKIKAYYEAHRSEFTLPAISGEGGGTEPQIAKLDEVKDNIRGYLAAVEARDLAAKAAAEEHARIKEMMEKETKTFEAAVEARNLKKLETPLFVRTDYLEGIGEASVLTDEALKLKVGDISAPVETRRGPLIFMVSDIRKADEAGFAKDKEEFSKKTLARKKIAALEKWLRAIESENGNEVLIDLTDYEKHYR